MAFTVTVLGHAAGGVPGPGGAGSGYLVQVEDSRLLVDCGNGVLGGLRSVASFDAVDAVFLSHLHADHMQDLLPLALWARFARREPLPVFGPEGLRSLCYRWFSLFHADPDPYAQAFTFHELAPWEVFRIGALNAMASPVEHNVPCFGLRVEPAGGGSRFFYSADTRAGGLVTEGAADSTVFLAEATFQDAAPDAPKEASRAHHMTAREAAEVAIAARAERLVLTHLRSDLDVETSLTEARAAFAGPVSAARIGDVIQVA